MGTAKASREVYGNAKPRRRIRGYQSSQPQQNRMPRKVNAPGSGKVDVSIFKWAKAGWKAPTW